jgi:hypothetical protein
MDAESVTLSQCSRVGKIAERLETAVFYGFNLRCILLSCEESELTVVENILDRCEEYLKSKGVAL